MPKEDSAWNDMIQPWVKLDKDKVETHKYRLSMAAEKIKREAEEDDTPHGIIKVDERWKVGGWAGSVATQRAKEARIARGGPML